MAGKKGNMAMRLVGNTGVWREISEFEGTFCLFLYIVHPPITNNNNNKQIFIQRRIHSVTMRFTKKIILTEVKSKIKLQ